MLLSCARFQSIRPLTRTSHRTFFSLNSLPSLPGFTSQPQTFKEKRLLPYTPKELYAVVADVASYPKFIPFCIGSRIDAGAIKKAMQEKTVVDAELTVGFMNLKESYVSKVTCIPHVSVQADASSATPLFKTLSTTWTFQSAASADSEPGPLADIPGPTWVKFDLTYEFANPLHAGVTATFFGQVSGMTIEAFEKRCREVYRR